MSLSFANAASTEFLAAHADGTVIDVINPEAFERAAFLTGDGELARYTAPSSQIVAVQPAPFTHVEILHAGLVNTPDGHQQVAVVVRATDTDDRVQVLEYALVVEQRDGRWEVSELLPAPSLAP